MKVLVTNPLHFLSVAQNLRRLRCCGSFVRWSTTGRGWNNWRIYWKNLCRGPAKATVSHQAKNWIFERR